MEPIYLAKQLEVGYRSLTFQAENTHATPSHAKKSTKKAGKSMILCGGGNGIFICLLYDYVRRFRLGR